MLTEERRRFVAGAVRKVLWGWGSVLLKRLMKTVLGKAAGFSRGCYHHQRTREGPSQSRIRTA